jgi:hypothetical protein
MIFVLIIFIILFGLYLRDKSKNREILRVNGGLLNLFSDYINMARNDFDRVEIIYVKEVLLEFKAIKKGNPDLFFLVKVGFNEQVTYKCSFEQNASILNCLVVVEGNITNQIKSYKIVFSEVQKYL